MLFACMATFVVLFANVFPASMGLTSSKVQPLDVNSPSDVPTSMARDAVENHVSSRLLDTDEPDLQDGFPTSRLIVPFHPDADSTCKEFILDSWTSLAGRLRPASEAHVTDVDTASSKQPQSIATIRREDRYNFECDTASMLWWDATSCSIHGDLTRAAPAAILADLQLDTKLPAGNIEDVPEPVIVEDDGALSSGIPHFIPALPLPKPSAAVCVSTTVPQLTLNTPTVSTDQTRLYITDSQSSVERSKADRRHHIDATAQPTKFVERVVNAQTCPSSIPTAHFLLPLQLPASAGPEDDGPKVPLSTNSVVMPQAAQPVAAHGAYLTMGKMSIFSTDSRAILRGVFTDFVCLESQYDPDLEQRLMGVESITMPPPHVMRAVARACGAALRFPATALVHVGTSVVAHVCAALQYEQVAQAAAWLMLLGAMIAAAYVLLSTPGAPEGEAALEADINAAPISFNLHFRSDAVPGAQDSPAYHPGQLFPASASDREASGSPIAAGVVSCSTEKRITPEPIATADACQCSSEAAAHAGSRSSSLACSIAEVGPADGDQAASGSAIPAAVKVNCSDTALCCSY